MFLVTPAAGTVTSGQRYLRTVKGQDNNCLAQSSTRYQGQLFTDRVLRNTD